MLPIFSAHSFLPRFSFPPFFLSTRFHLWIPSLGLDRKLASKSVNCHCKSTDWLKGHSGNCGRVTLSLLVCFCQWIRGHYDWLTLESHCHRVGAKSGFFEAIQTPQPLDLVARYNPRDRAAMIPPVEKIYNLFMTFLHARSLASLLHPSKKSFCSGPWVR